MVLLDMRMAVMDGMEFLDELHQTSGATDVPIIIITGTPELPESAHEHCVKAVLTKPSTSAYSRRWSSGSFPAVADPTTTIDPQGARNSYRVLTSFLHACRTMWIEASV